MHIQKGDLQYFTLLYSGQLDVACFQRYGDFYAKKVKKTLIN